MILGLSIWMLIVLVNEARPCFNREPIPGFPSLYQWNI
jgi:hypothetical protein